MLDIGVEAAFEHVTGQRPRVLGYAERESYAAALLLARMEDASLEPAPVFCGDFRELDARPLRGFVHILTAGLPCQPYSCAGKQAGLSDARSYGADGDGPLPHALRIISECAPSLVCLENVPQWVQGGYFRTFGAALAALGYEIEDPLFLRAEDVGASHRRERVFILAHLPGKRDDRAVSAGPGREGQRTSHPERSRPGLAHTSGKLHDGRGYQRPRWGANPAIYRDTLEHADHTRRSGQRQRQGPSSDLGPRCEAMAHASGEGLPHAESAPESAPESNAELCSTFIPASFFAPGPRSDLWAGILSDLPHFAPAVEPGLCVLADGLAWLVDASRPDQLRVGGNGVVALQAAAAFADLFTRPGVRAALPLAAAPVERGGG